MRVTTLLLLAGALLVGAGCETASHYLAGDPLPGTTRAMTPKVKIDGALEWHGEQSRVEEREYVVARSAGEWQALWQRVGVEPPGDLPAGAMALGVFLGTRASAGYGTRIEDVSLTQRPGQPDLLVAVYREKVPPPAIPVSQTQTAPYAVRLVVSADAEVRFVPAGAVPRS